MMAIDTKSELRKRTQQSIKTEDIATTSTSPEHKDIHNHHHDENMHSHELFQSMKAESKRLIFDPKNYPKEKVFCSHADKHKIPVYMYEKYVWGGYRMNLSFKEAFLSIFQINNETVNNWTAILSALVFLYFTIDVIFFWEHTPENLRDSNSGYSGYFNHYVSENFLEKTMFVVYCVSSIITFSASLFYHWFSCMSESSFHTLLRIDISSIALLIGGSYYPPLYYAFYCSQSLGVFYISTISILCLSCVAMFIIPRFSREDYRQFRVRVFGFTALYGLCPLVHIIYIYGFENDALNNRLLGIMYMYLCYAAGVFFYSTKLPERIWPGKFDIFCHSHQFWHIFVFSATLLHFYNCVYMKTESGVCFAPNP